MRFVEKTRLRQPFSEWISSSISAGSTPLRQRVCRRTEVLSGVHAEYGLKAESESEVHSPNSSESWFGAAEYLATGRKAICFPASKRG